MDRSEWTGQLEALHHKVRQGQAVGAAELAWYHAARRSLLAAAIEVQSLALHADAIRRSSIRIPRAAQVLLEAGGWSAQTLTVDLGSGGFAALLEAPPPVLERIRATLVLPGEGPVITTVAVADARSVGGLARVAFRFSEPGEEAWRRVEDYLMDGVLEQLVFWDDVMARLRV